jgi:ATP-dependent DNA helicase PIF1
MSILNSLLAKLGTRPVIFGDLNRTATREPETATLKRPVQAPTQPPEPIVATREYKAVLDLLEHGAPIIFVTGEAGTGKSTLIRWLRSSLNRKFAVIAPTGVAALNAEGVTIHSFFKFPHKIVQDRDIKRVYDRSLYQKLDLLIIDEVSMARCDLLDGIDKFLRMNRSFDAPFGGVQLLLIGYLFQLPPVVPHAEERVLRGLGYSSGYFFSAYSLQATEAIPVELKLMFRQKDNFYINLLSKVRIGEDLDYVIEEMNKKCCRAEYNRSSITLTCTNAVADEINRRELEAIQTEKAIFCGSLKGRFKLENKNLPSPYNLELKAGTRVMFTKNGASWVNGSLGIVREIESEKGLIRVELEGKGKGSICNVGQATWEQYDYTYDHAKDEIVAEIIGEYTQYPLMLAWAVTIHKSQGKTLDNVLVDFGKGAFAHGQAYVALSRCRSIDDIRFQRPLRTSDIKCDPVIKRFYEATFRPVD